MYLLSAVHAAFMEQGPPRVRISVFNADKMYINAHAHIIRDFIIILDLDSWPSKTILLYWWWLYNNNIMRTSPILHVLLIAENVVEHAYNTAVDEKMQLGECKGDLNITRLEKVCTRKMLILHYLLFYGNRSFTGIYRSLF